jgi:hypothetical protein
MPRHPGLVPSLLPALAFGLSLAFAGPSLAQTALDLPPPSGTPAAKAPATKAPAAKKPRQARKPRTPGTTDEALDLPGVAKTTTAAKPRRFVPEEFDNGDESGSPRPFMSESGRPGLGMRF